MPITFACQHCDRSYTVADTLAGKKAKCKACGKAMDVPDEVPIAAEVVSPVAQATGRAKANSPSRKAASSRAKQRRHEKDFGLGELSGTDIFSGSNPAKTQSLDNHAFDPGFAQVTPEEIAYRREAELAEMRDKKPKLEDYLTDDDRLAVQFGVAAREADEDDVSWKAVLPAIVITAVMFVFMVIGVVMALFENQEGPAIMLIVLYVLATLCSMCSWGWGIMICSKYHSEQIILYILVPFYALIYTIRYANLNKGPLSMWLANFCGGIFIGILFVVLAVMFEDL